MEYLFKLSISQYLKEVNSYYLDFPAVSGVFHLIHGGLYLFLYGKIISFVP